MLCSIGNLCREKCLSVKLISMLSDFFNFCAALTLLNKVLSSRKSAYLIKFLNEGLPHDPLLLSGTLPTNSYKFMSENGFALAVKAGGCSEVSRHFTMILRAWKSIYPNRQIRPGEAQPLREVTLTCSHLHGKSFCPAGTVWLHLHCLLEMAYWEQ